MTQVQRLEKTKNAAAGMRHRGITTGIKKMYIMPGMVMDKEIRRYLKKSVGEKSMVLLSGKS